LRSTHEVSGYHIQATDGEIGHVEDFIIDDDTWTIRYLLINTLNWWPGKKVLVSPQWIERVSWGESKVFVNLSRETIKQSPEYTEEFLLTRDYEDALHRHYNRKGYWADELVAGPNLMAGNVVMVKHAGCVPQCALAFEKLWLEAGAPVGAYTNLFISYGQVNKVIDDPRIKGVALTGSVGAGKSVAARERDKTSKSPPWNWAAVMPSLCLTMPIWTKTVKWAVWAKMNNTGQCCVAGEAIHRRGRTGRPLSRDVPKALAALKPGRSDGPRDNAWPSFYRSGPVATAGPDRRGRRQRCNVGDGRKTD
jgi:hypothetical protein